MLKNFITYMKRNNLIKRCDKLFSQFIRLKHGKCEQCEETETIQPSHCYGRANMSVRWDELNVLCLCNNHHREWERMSQKDREHFLIDWYGENIFRELLKKKNEEYKWSIIELQALANTLKAKIDRLKLS